MVTIHNCEEDTLRRIMAGLRKIAIGHTVSFVFEEGTHSIVDGADVFETPNGTATFRMFVDGGAKDSGERIGEPAAPVMVEG